MSMEERDEWLMAAFVRFVDDGFGRDEIRSRIQDIFLFDDRRVLEVVVDELYGEAEKRGFLELVPLRGEECDAE